MLRKLIRIFHKPIIKNEILNDTQHEPQKPKLFQKTADVITLEEAIQLYKPNFIPKGKRISKERLKELILSAVALGDISGSRYEGRHYPGLDTDEILQAKKEHIVYNGWKTIDLFSDLHHLTDDTVLTIAIYKATQHIKESNITNDNDIINIYTKYLRDFTRLYPDVGFAAGFENWAFSDTNERNFSYGNGACMRVGGLAVLCDDINELIRFAYLSALPSHGHNEGVKGSICTAVVYWMLVYGATKEDILKYMQKQYPANNEYPINSATTMKDLIDMTTLNPWSTLSVICQTSLVEAVINFLDSESFEDCLRNGYKYLCDRDTISAIAAPMAAIYYNDYSISNSNGKELVERYLDERLISYIRS